MKESIQQVERVCSRSRSPTSLGHGLQHGHGHTASRQSNRGAGGRSPLRELRRKSPNTGSRSPNTGGSSPLRLVPAEEKKRQWIPCKQVCHEHGYSYYK